MMSLTTMAPSAWRYYAEEIALGREDYFAKGAERPGRFLGRGAEALGIADHEAHVAARTALRPRSRPARRVPRSGVASIPTTSMPSPASRSRSRHRRASRRCGGSPTNRPPQSPCGARRCGRRVARVRGGPRGLHPTRPQRRPPGRHRRAPRRGIRPPDLACRRPAAPHPRPRRQQGPSRGRRLARPRWAGAVRDPEGDRDALQGGAPRWS